MRLIIVEGQTEEAFVNAILAPHLLNHIPGYSKTLHGPLAIEDTGLAVLRSKCPRFDAWLVALESLVAVS